MGDAVGAVVDAEGAVAAAGGSRIVANMRHGPTLTGLQYYIRCLPAHSRMDLGTGRRVPRMSIAG